jgi:hypothetical protein
MAIFDEQVLEPFVAKGIGDSGVASRQIQASNLPDLSAAVRESAATQQELQRQQESLSKARGLVSLSGALTRKSRGSSGSSGDKFLKPFAVGTFRQGGGSGVTVAVPNAKGGFKLQSYFDEIGKPQAVAQKLETLGIPQNLSSLPSLGFVGQGDYTREGLAQRLARYGKTGTESKMDMSDINLRNLIKDLLTR